MNKKLLFSLLLAGTAFTGHADEARLLRFPATNGSDIVFSYAGDLYKAPLNGGEAQKLTSHIGYEMFARFSPDGKSIAFTGQYDGNTEVYLIPTDGGEPQRLFPDPVPGGTMMQQRLRSRHRPHQRKQGLLPKQPPQHPAS